MGKNTYMFVCAFGSLILNHSHFGFFPYRILYQTYDIYIYMYDMICDNHIYIYHIHMEYT